jgi:heat shock protein HtpX
MQTADGAAGVMNGGVPEVLRRRADALRWSAAAILASLLINAGAIVLLVALISDSVLVSLCTAGVMAAFVLLLYLFADTFFMTATGARQLRQGEFAWLQPMVRELASRAGIEEPEVLISDQESLNAYTIGTGRRAKVVFMRGLLEQLPREEVRAVAAHEIGHVVNRDVIFSLWSWTILAWVLFVGFLAFVAAWALFGFAGGAASTGDDWTGVLVGWIIAAIAFTLAIMLVVVTLLWTTVARVAQLAVTRQREFLADATAAALTGQPKVLASALARASEDPSMPRGGSLVGRFCIVSPVSRTHWWDELFSTHPHTAARIRELSKLPSVAVRLADEDWEGIGAVGLLLPLGALVVLLAVAVVIPIA